VAEKPWPPNLFTGMGRAYVPKWFMQIYRDQLTLKERLDLADSARGDRFMKAIREIARG
jgi:hypothetical protein